MASFLSAAEYLNIFEDYGPYLKLVNDIRDACDGTASGGLDVPDRLAAIITALAGNGRSDVLSGTQEAVDGLRDQLIGYAEGNLMSFVTRRLLHRTTVLEKLPVSANASVGEVLLQMFRDMGNVAVAQTIERSTVTLGSLTTQSTGNGTVVLDKVLDGVTSPGIGMQANLSYAGVDSELAVTSETMIWTCVRDSDTDGVPEGEEVFRWEGGPRSPSRLTWRNEGSGVGPDIPTANASQLILNKDFETWTTANIPDNWDLDSGTAGTTVLQETSAANVYRGASALKFTGNGSQASQQVSQTVNFALVPNKRYVVSCRVMGQASTVAGQLTIQFESPSGAYSAAGSEDIVMDATALSAATSYGHQYFFITMPAVIPSDFELVIKVTGTLTNAKSVWVDSLTLAPLVWHGGISAFIPAGSTPFRRGDRFYGTISNDNAGVFQTNLRRFYGVQLPSDSSPTIADTLVA